MELAVGTIVSGKVTTITKFGAFVALPDGRSGLVHISEVADSFVSDVHDFLTEGQEISVKVLSVTPDGKINLSVKQTQPRQSHGPHRPRQERPRQENSRQDSNRRAPVLPRAATPPAESSFEDKLKQFMTLSDTKQSELNRYMKAKRGGKRRK